MSVTKAADLLGVGRPALSNFLNGKAGLSRDLAHRLAKVFGGDSEELLRLQASYESTIAEPGLAGIEVTRHVPLLLKVRGKQLSIWAESIESRSRLPVLIRRLVRSTAQGLIRIDFPGFEDVNRSGFDGWTETGGASPWVPLGETAWECSVDKKITAKANTDYEKRTKKVSADIRAKTTLIIVTTRSWAKKKEWRKTKNNLAEWKDIRAYDASDLEQWLESSLEGQIWISEELEVPLAGLRTLPGAWDDWCGDSGLLPDLFAEPVKGWRSDIEKWIQTSTPPPLRIAADSVGEGLSFLNACLDDLEMGPQIDRAIVVDTPLALRSIRRGLEDQLIVIHTMEVERELGQLAGSFHVLRIQAGTGMREMPDILLQPLSHESFGEALESMGLDKDRIVALAQESGRSPTVLRRRLSKLEAVRAPRWSETPEEAILVGLLSLIGRWEVQRTSGTEPTADQVILTCLSGLQAEEIDTHIAHLLALDDSPLWKAGDTIGVISKLDSWYATFQHIGMQVLDRFFDIAEMVLTEPDPSLELSEDMRWASAIYGKMREFSKTLRKSIADTLAFLANPNCPGGLKNETIGHRVASCVDSLMSSLNSERFESLSDVLPLLAEAAPMKFLEIIERDLASPHPAVDTVMRPAGNELFSSCPRTPILWSLETVAWNNDNVTRAVRILASLCRHTMQDNWMNTPLRSLSAIFCIVKPQCALNEAGRRILLDMLWDEFPEVAWKVCVTELTGGPRFLPNSHKPKWRNDAYGHGAGKEYWDDECHQAGLHMISHLLSRPSYSVEMMIDLIQLRLPDEERMGAWDLLTEWASTADDSERSLACEVIRSTFGVASILAQDRDFEQPEGAEEAHEIYLQLLPTDPILKHRWLFQGGWNVDLFPAELEAADEKPIETYTVELCVKAVLEILEHQGRSCVPRLAELEINGYQLGRILIEELGDADLAWALDQLIRNGTNGSLNLARGLLQSISESRLGLVLKQSLNAVPEEKKASLLLLAPFHPITWDSTIQQSLEQEYWSEVIANPFRRDTELGLITHSVRNLVRHGRPRQALHALRMNVDRINGDLLLEILKDLGHSREKGRFGPEDTWVVREMLNTITDWNVGTLNERALLEWKLMALLERRYSFRNLKSEIDQNPDLVVQAIRLGYRRTDGIDDMADFTEDERENQAHFAFHLLHSLHWTPGRNSKEEIDEELLDNWIRSVQRGCISNDRKSIGDSVIGTFLSAAPVGEDEIWPCLPVRNMLEKHGNQSMAGGFSSGKYNSRGAHFVDASGDRQLAQQYSDWAQDLRITHPKTAAILREIALSYTHQANRHEEDDQRRRRMV